MSQHSMKKGIKLFGQAGIDAVLAELNQLHERKVLKPKDSSKLSREEKKAALQYLMFLKQKRCGKIKGRGCADGRKQIGGRKFTHRVHRSRDVIMCD